MSWQGELVKRVVLYHNNPDTLESWIVDNVPRDYWLGIAQDLDDSIYTNLSMRLGEMGCY